MLAQFGRSRATLRRSVVHALRFLTSAQPNSFRTYATIPSSEDQPALKAGSRSFKRDREIRSLDPAQLRPSDFVDFSDMKKPGLWIQGVLTRLEYWPATTLRNRLKSSDVVANHDGRFPAGTRGFLYYHSPPLGPASGGQLRLRITDSADPSAFARGYDLRTPHELPWCLPLPKLVGMHNGNQLARVLVQQGLVSQAAVDGCSTRTYRWRMPVAATTSLSQLFYYDFSSTRISFRIIHGEEQPKLVFLSPRLDPRRDACTIWPWTGAAHCRLEPIIGRKGTMRPAIRVVRIIVPPTPTIAGYDGYVPRPAEGELLTRAFGHTPITFPLDYPRLLNLRLFVERESKPDASPEASFQK